ncbi:MAG: hypothetical protein HY052_10040, partial [Proteobacteria bacterium]|nr:hypothetical protein [Pseudomonadota bacterium]
MENETHKFLLERKTKLEAELAMINAGLRAAGITSIEVNRNAPKGRGRPPSGKKTISQEILEVLEEYPSGLRTNDVK